MAETETILVAIQRGADPATAVLSVVAGEPSNLSLNIEDGRVWQAGGADLFDALKALRLELQQCGIALLCAGARKDVHPSRMSRQMSAGRKAYVTRLGAPSTPEDLIDIFDFAAPELVGSVEDQDAHLREWMASLLAIRSEDAPHPDEIKEAKSHLGGWVYRIAPGVQKGAAVPPGAIVGAWKVDERGRIIGAFKKNPNHDMRKWPV